MSSSSSSLPSPSADQKYVTVSPLTGGHLTLPDSAFISPADPAKKRYVPSLSFLIIHPGTTSPSPNPIIKSQNKPLRILFDLGLRHNLKKYSALQQKHLDTRTPYNTQPGIAEQLEKGGVDPGRINVVVLSHVHYDHHGDPEDFSNAQFIVGNGSLEVLANGLPSRFGSHQHFSPPDLLPPERTTELLATSASSSSQEWKPLGPFPHTLDLLGDGSLFVIDTPGHLPGHINLLCRLGPEGQEGKGRWVCLCGDAYHDPRLLSGEREIGTWELEGRTCCIHVDRGVAEDSIRKLRSLKELGVEMIAAHDDEWCGRNGGSFFPGHI